MLTVRVPWQVEYAVKHEMAVTVKDMLSLRMRLAYINSEAAKQAIPRVAELMAQHLKWSKKEKNRQVKLAEDYLGQFGGPVADKKGAKLRQATATDLHEVFAGQDKAMSGFIDVKQLNAASIQVRHCSHHANMGPTATWAALHPHPNPNSHPYLPVGLPLPQRQGPQDDLLRDRYQPKGAHLRARVRRVVEQGPCSAWSTPLTTYF